MKISVTIITLNEEANLPRCLDSCRELADELVVVDSGSTDGTERIAKDAGARFLSQPWLGFVGQKNFALDQARHPWVLSLDADEALSPELRAEIAVVKARAHSPPPAGYSMPRCVLYERRWIRHGDWYPDRLVRLFQRRRARFAGAKVHERLELDGPVEHLRGEIEHHSFKDRADHWHRCQKYARLWAESRAEEGKRAWAGAAWGHAVFRWIRAYLLRRGFLDGTQGWWIAWFAAREVHLKYRILQQLQRSPGRD